MPRTTRELLDIMSNHADGKEAIAATLNTPQGKGKHIVDHGEGMSLCFKKKKNDKHRCDDNFVVAVERKMSRPKGNPTEPHRPRTTWRGSWTRRARTTKSPSSTRSGIAGS
jgi:hypothetical protein